MALHYFLLSCLFGLVIGSFLNVCIWRIPRKISVMRPVRSFCPNCSRQLTAWENIPVLSWIVLGGRCKTCKAPISGRYPLVEILSAVAGGMSYLHFDLSFSALIIYALVATLIVISFIDLDFKIIPNVISLPGMTFGLLLGAFTQFYPLHNKLTAGAIDSLVGFLLGGGFFWAIGVTYYLITKRTGLGGGDIKLMAMIGAVLGWRAIAPTVFTGSLFGAVVGIAAMIISGQGRKTEIPFGPWLSVGAILYIFDQFQFFQF